MKVLKRFIWIVLIALLGIGGYAGYVFFLKEGKANNLYSFIPEDFIILIESDKPVQDWKGLSNSQVWKTLKESEYFGEITKSANSLDSLLKNNEKIAEMAKIGRLLISTHVISKDNYDFLIALDLNDDGKLSNFKAVLNPVFRQAGYKVSMEKAFGRDIYKLYDPKEHETLFLSLVDNVLLASYTFDLVKKGIMHSETGNIMDNANFKKVYDASVRDGNYSFMVNYASMNAFLKVFTPQPPDMIAGLNESLSFSGATLTTSGEEVRMEGYSDPLDSATTYINAFKNAGKGKVNAQSVLPQTTALFTSLGFSDFRRFMESLRNVYKKTGQKEYDEMMKTKKQLEGYLKINLEEDFFSWMNEEASAAVVAVPQSDGSVVYENLALLHFRKGDYEKVKEKLDRVMKQIKRKTPVKFEKETYSGYDIEYLEMKGFFKLFFKKLFSKIEKPHFIIIDDYVIFSNNTSSLKYVIDSYLDEKILAKQPDFPDFYSKFGSSSSIFMYIQNQYFYDYTLKSLDAGSQTSLAKNQKAFRSFSHIGLQVIPEGDMLQNNLYSRVQPWTEPVVPRAIPTETPSSDSIPDTVNDSVQ